MQPDFFPRLNTEPTTPPPYRAVRTNCLLSIEPFLELKNDRVR